MASPQLENGYTRIANELLDAVIGTPFIATHLKIVLVCWRYLYGFNRVNAELSESFISKATGISKRYISKELKTLIEANVISVIREPTYTTPRIISFNKDYESWRYRTRVPQLNQSSTAEPESSTTVELQFNTTGELQFHQETKTIKKDKERVSVQFEQFWSVYPKRRGKQAAIKAFQKLKPSVSLFKTILSQLEKQKEFPEWQKDNGQYIPYPATWLNGRRWEDEMPERDGQAYGDVI